jgi:hypothetical protein
MPRVILIWLKISPSFGYRVQTIKADSFEQLPKDNNKQNEQQYLPRQA